MSDIEKKDEELPSPKLASEKSYTGLKCENCTSLGKEVNNLLIFLETQNNNEQVTEINILPICMDMMWKVESLPNLSGFQKKNMVVVNNFYICYKKNNIYIICLDTKSYNLIPYYLS